MQHVQNEIPKTKTQNFQYKTSKKAQNKFKTNIKIWNSNSKCVKLNIVCVKMVEM